VSDGYEWRKLRELSWYTDAMRNRWGLFSSKKALLATIRDLVLLCCLILLWRYLA
jgi:hypothetical protein